MRVTLAWVAHTTAPVLSHFLRCGPTIRVNGGEFIFRVAMKRLGLFALAIVACVLVAIQLPLIKIEIPIPAAKITPDSGFSYLFEPVKFDGPVFYFLADTPSANTMSSLSLFENGKLVGPPHAVHESIRKNGLGGFSHWNNYWGDQLFFSSSDNTDPRVNGRTYKATDVLRLTDRWRKWTLSALGITLACMLMFARTQIAPIVIRALKKLRTRESIISLAKLVAVAALFAISWRPYLTATTAGSWFESTVQAFGAFWWSGHPFLATFYAAVLIAATVGVCAAPFIDNGKIRLPLAFLIVVAFLADAIVLNISGQNLTLDMVDTLWRERAVGVNAVAAYAGVISRLGVLFAVLFVILAWRPNWRVGRALAVIPIVSLFGMFAIVYTTYGATTASPPWVAVPTQLAFVNLAGARISEVREPIDYPETPQPRFKKIVFIVDESVRADYLSLNNPKLDNTPSLAALQPYMANFGVASAGANCSAAARLFMRMSLKPSELPDVAQVWSQKSTMWAFAKLAGFTTVLVDAHAPPASLFHSYMNLSEARSIDEIKQMADTPVNRRDRQIPALLLDLLSRDEPMFIVVNKYGVHPPYDHTMPPDFQYKTDRAPTNPKLNAARNEIISQYDRALKWSVDGFFEALGSKIVRDDTLILYTSDHGQAMFDGGYENQHCSLGERIANGEVFVPLFFVTREKHFLQDMQDAARRSRDQASHFEIFPTLLYTMGYAKPWIDQQYGSTLLNVPENRQRQFLMGTFYHQSTKWLTLGRDGLTTRSY
jgi:glucan phosphoethanolaminetransferase (alkaline phosphatase superfamily)